MRACHLHLSSSILITGTPSVTIPLPATSTSSIEDIPQSSAAAAARQPGPIMAHRVDCSSVDTVETRVRDTERRMMAALEVVNLRVSYQERERLAYEQESMENRQALARSEAYSRALEARIIVLETQEMAPKRATRSTPVTENPTTTTVTNAQLQAMIDQGVTAALTARDANRNGDDSHTSGTGARRTERVTRECTYQDFMKCQPLYFKGTEGVVELTQWFERMETVFRISNCSVENQIKFSTCTLLAGALTWWNSHVRIVGHDVAYAMTWIDLRKKMTDKYCPRNEIKKLETELWNLKVKGTDVTGYNQRFQELALLCVRMFPEESDKVERYVGGLPDMIHGSVVASKPKTMQEATEMATELMDKKISTFAERQAENKRKLDNNHQAQQQLPKRQNVVQAYAAGTGERKEYAGTLPLCNKCKFHHNGPCTVKCANCKRVGHLTRDCWSSAATNNQRTLTCYECGNQGHYRSDCPELKNGNQAGGTGTHGMVLALGGGETDQDPNNIEDEIEA
ncbi:reverse transcriptase domain-containing protein [Tanacetum coccineum]|uniref:Reverse transcriptase domain-containing protein n=1 Tax=Tanacetum coccineum TaxID=301880 RepID=A0ABQ5DKR4_9ASTR